MSERSSSSWFDDVDNEPPRPEYHPLPCPSGWDRWVPRVEVTEAKNLARLLFEKEGLTVAVSDVHAQLDRVRGWFREEVTAEQLRRLTGW
ncbi:hypothetical protein GCM10022221_68460 [Actinocorallia aurea]